MTAYTAPAPHRTPLPVRPSRTRKLIPHVRNRYGALLALAGLVMALASLYLPWLAPPDGTRLSALDITRIIDVRSIAPLLFLGLVAITVLVALTAMTRLGFFAASAAGVSAVILVAHLVFLWTLNTSLGAETPTLMGLPEGASLTYGPFVAALGFVLILGGSLWAALSAEHVLPDPHEERFG